MTCGAVASLIVLEAGKRYYHVGYRCGRSEGFGLQGDEEATGERLKALHASIPRECGLKKGHP